MRYWVVYKYDIAKYLLTIEEVYVFKYQQYMYSYQGCIRIGFNMFAN